MTTHPIDHRRSRMTTAEIQQELDLIRLAYRDRCMEPLNRHRHNLPWITLGMVIGSIIAAVLYF